MQNVKFLYENTKSSSFKNFKQLKHDQHLFVYKNVRLSQLFSHRCDADSKNYSNIEGYDYKIQNYSNRFYHEGVSGSFESCGYFRILNKANVSEYTKSIDPNTLLLTFEANFFNPKINLWTVLKGSRLLFLRFFFFFNLF